MAHSFVEFLRMSRDIARCLSDEGRLTFPMPLETGILPLGQRIVEGTLDKRYPIDVSCIDASSPEAASVLLRHHNHAEIRYSRTLNFCWRRFAVCKELSHLLLDTASEFSTDYVAMAPLLAANTLMPQWLTDQTSAPYYSETVCEFGALELLMPWPIRGQLTQMSAQGKSDFEIATFCKVPERWVTIILKGAYSEVSTTLNREYDRSIGVDWAPQGLLPGSSTA